jgi:hypothetical protein
LAPALALVKALKEQKLHETLVFPSPRAKRVSDMVLASFLRASKLKATRPDAWQQRMASAQVFAIGPANKDMRAILPGGRSRMQWRIRLKRPITAPTCWNSAARCWKLGQSMFAATEPIVP